MWFINANRNLIGLILVSTLAACAAVPSQDIASQKVVDDIEAASTPEQAVTDVTDGEPAADQRVISINPYLQNPPIVPPELARLFAEALERQHAQQWPLAENLWLTITEQYPSFSGPWLNLGLVQQQLDQEQAAMLSFRQAIDANPSNLDAYNVLAISLREQGQFIEAENLYKAALAQWPDHADSHRNLGILYDLYLHQPEPALYHYRQTQQLSNSDNEAAQRQLKGWIVELERRQKASYANAETR